MSKLLIDSSIRENHLQKKSIKGMFVVSIISRTVEIILFLIGKSNHYHVETRQCDSLSRDRQCMRTIGDPRYCRKVFIDFDYILCVYKTRVFSTVSYQIITTDNLLSRDTQRSQKHEKEGFIYKFL